MNRQDFVARLGIEVRTVEFWLEQEWIVPGPGETEPAFSDTDVARGHLIQDLKTSFGVNDQGVDIILHLVDQLHGLRRAFEDLHAGLKSDRTE